MTQDDAIDSPEALREAWNTREGGNESSRDASFVPVLKTVSATSMLSDRVLMSYTNSASSCATKIGGEYCLETSASIMPLTSSVMENLESLLKGQFGELSAIDESEENEEGQATESRAENEFRNSCKKSTRIIGLGENGAQSPSTMDVGGELDDAHPSCITRLVEHKSFTIFFMTWTFYALFAVDIDLLCGNKESKLVLSIITSVAVVFFLIELVCQSMGRKNYVLRAYFWLDAVALISLLPDTWFVQNLFAADNAFVAGRTSRLTRLIRIASRSSKATRLNRLTRLVRVASLMPRLGAFMGRRAKEEDIEKMLAKKLRRVFIFLDEDMDGLISRSALHGCLLKMKQDQKKGENAKIPKTASHKDGSGDECSPTTSNGDFLPGALNCEPESPKSFNLCSSLSSKKSLPSRIKLAFSRSKTAPEDRTFTTVQRDVQLPGEEMMVSFKEFRDIMMSDDDICVKLRRACRQQMRQGNNVKLQSSHSEYIAVKVALGVLMLLFVLGLVEPDVRDKSAERGLTHMTTLTKLKFANHTAQDFIPTVIHDQVTVFTQGNGVDPEKRTLLYLDMDKKVYCNEFVTGGRSCEPDRMSFLSWTFRESIKQIDKEVEQSDYRLIDLLPVRVPDFDGDQDISDEQLNVLTESIAVLYVRGASQEEAVMSILTTILVIIIILSGIVILTKDLTYLTQRLLKPLRELADDMESIAQLQLAGVSGADDAAVDEGTSEVRLIRRTFENMKNAIKSWGKYVPWPVVQLLLRANVEANLEVNEVEVTIFFSDIASFTTIVESMPPESSLLLLSRYFNDMSKVIDDHGGVVLEFIGDAILCIYGAPLMNADHPTAAVKASLRMLTSLRRMNEWSISKKLPQVQIRCGVHTGRVLVGNLGFHSRMKYGIVGEDAHIPSRLEELNKTYGTSLIISEATWGKLDTGALFISRPIDYINVRQILGNSSEPIYEVMHRDRKSGKHHPLWEPARLHHEGMELYKARDFQAALERFNQIGKLIKDFNGNEDISSKLLAKRCTSYIEDPPPANWDGEWDRS